MGDVVENLNKSVPVGMKDFLFDDAKKRRFIERKVTDVFESRGFYEIITPAVEYYDTFKFADNGIGDEDMYKLFDSKGHILALRSDMTTPVARVSATKLKDMPLPVKLYYNASVFLMSENLKGRLGEIPQCGCEIIGISGIRADVEIVITAIEAIKALGIEDFKLEIGNVGFFKAIISQIDKGDEFCENIRLLIENKNFASLNSELEKYDNMPDIKILRELPYLFGGVEVLDKVSGVLKNAQALEALGHLKELFDVLTGLGYGEYISLDLGMVHHISYYTGLVFRGYIPGSGGAILSGGRYDNLVSKFGAGLCATGFAISVETIREKFDKKTETKEDDRVAHVINISDIPKFKSIEGDIEISLYGDINDTLKYAAAKSKKTVLVFDGQKISTMDLRGV